VLPSFLNCTFTAKLGFSLSLAKLFGNFAARDSQNSLFQTMEKQVELAAWLKYRQVAGWIQL
jgi:hypothetical protein